MLCEEAGLRLGVLTVNVETRDCGTAGVPESPDAGC